MTKTIVFDNVHITTLEDSINEWLSDNQNKIKRVEILSTAQSQHKDYVTLTIFYQYRYV